MAERVGFVGLGNMGGPMALNLVKAGFELVVHDINPASVFVSKLLDADKLSKLEHLTHHKGIRPGKATPECRV